MKDYHGREITVEEDPDTEIIVWTIEPSIYSAYEYAVTRAYQDAVGFAKRVVEHLMDDPDVELPVTIKIDQQKMRLSDYEELCEAGV